MVRDELHREFLLFNLPASCISAESKTMGFTKNISHAGELHIYQSLMEGVREAKMYYS